jgi:hypothetical protein
MSGGRIATSGGTTPSGGTAGSSTGGRTGGTAGTATGGNQTGGTVTAGNAGAETGGAETAGAAGAETGGAETAGAAGAESGGAESGGAETAGTESGGAATAGTSSGGTDTGGAATAGAGGEETGGAATAGAGGEATGGAATGGVATAGAGGEATGGAATAGAGGAGGAGLAFFNFETDAQGWAIDGANTSVAVSGDQYFDGTHALAITLPALTSVAADPDAGISQTCDQRTVAIGSPPGAASLWPGAVVTLHIWVPTPVGGLGVQAFSQSNNYGVWDTNGNSGNGTLVAGGWTTWTYTVPNNTMPGGMNKLGIQLQVCGGGTFAGGTLYLDALSVSGGTVSCAGTATATYGWETASSVDGWTVDNTPADTALSQSTAQAYSGGGTGSLQVAFTSLAAGASRRIMLDKPNVYCGQTVTFHVWAPTGFGSGGMSIQPFSQLNNFDSATGWNSGAVVTPTENAWNTITYALPQTGPGGMQRIGVQFVLSSSATAAYTGNAYIDAVTW